MGRASDGLAVDADGTLYFGCRRPDRVDRWRLSDPPVARGQRLSTVTNLCFGGPGPRTLFLTGLGGWAVHELDMERPGAGLALPPSSPQ